MCSSMDLEYHFERWYFRTSLCWLCSSIVQASSVPLRFLRLLLSIRLKSLVRASSFVCCACLFGRHCLEFPVELPAFCDFCLTGPASSFTNSQFSHFAGLCIALNLVSTLVFILMAGAGAFARIRTPIAACAYGLFAELSLVSRFAFHVLCQFGSYLASDATSEFLQSHPRTTRSRKYTKNFCDNLLLTLHSSDTARASMGWVLLPWLARRRLSSVCTRAIFNWLTPTTPVTLVTLVAYTTTSVCFSTVRQSMFNFQISAFRSVCFAQIELARHCNAAVLSSRSRTIPG